MTDSKGHPHADLMLLYAQHSKTNAEEWRNWEYRCSDSEWIPVPGDICWTKSVDYRRKPEPFTRYAVVSARDDVVFLCVHRATAIEEISRYADRGYHHRLVKLVEVQE